ncbi:DUF6243 family protein [Streptomyces sp. NPDC002466]|uniref:DUF6243 family protein n=1 Tax=unclassified Streptomyces TaxID=2593676 RepID=UPI0011E6AB62|nr:DUF6243 family protein [Streptomyces sp. sk2.1]TXS78496.1 hypothetical protein EAO76_08960 [Streptomyces sp. sk2.1]
MAKSRNNLLGVGGQRKKLSRADQQGVGSARVTDRKAAADQKQELLRRMRERAQPGTAPEAQPDAADTSAQPETAGQEASDRG